MGAIFIFAPPGSFAILKLKIVPRSLVASSRECSDPIVGGALVELIPENNRLAAIIRALVLLKTEIFRDVAQGPIALRFKTGSLFHHFTTRASKLNIEAEQCPKRQSPFDFQSKRHVLRLGVGCDLQLPFQERLASVEMRMNDRRIGQ